MHRLLDLHQAMFMLNLQGVTLCHAAKTLSSNLSLRSAAITSSFFRTPGEPSSVALPAASSRRSPVRSSKDLCYTSWAFGQTLPFTLEPSRSLSFFFHSPGTAGKSSKSSTNINSRLIEATSVEELMGLFRAISSSNAQTPL